jgi:hypothetical protein
MPPVSAFTIAPFRMGLAGVASSSVLAPLAFILVLTSTGQDVDRTIVMMVVLVTGVGQALLGLAYLSRLVQPAPFGRDIRAMLRGDSWAHWQYDETQWREAIRIETQRSRRGLRKPTLVVLATGAVVALVGLAASGGSGVVLLLIGVGSAGIWGYVCLVMLATNVDTWARTRKTGEISISRLGIYHRPGGYTPLTSAGYQLSNVTLINAAPAYLRFEVTHRRSLLLPRTALADVVVPVGREDEASQLVDRFRTQLAARR